jgi:hypothetical protein
VELGRNTFLCHEILGNLLVQKNISGSKSRSRAMVILHTQLHRQFLGVVCVVTAIFDAKATQTHVLCHTQTMRRVEVCVQSA